jgi:hypothetical protein
VRFSLTASAIFPSGAAQDIFYVALSRNHSVAAIWRKAVVVSKNCFRQFQNFSSADPLLQLAGIYLADFTFFSAAGVRR